MYAWLASSAPFAANILFSGLGGLKLCDFGLALDLMDEQPSSFVG